MNRDWSRVLAGLGGQSRKSLHDLSVLLTFECKGRSLDEAGNHNVLITMHAFCTDMCGQGVAGIEVPAALFLEVVPDGIPGCSELRFKHHPYIRHTGHMTRTKPHLQADAGALYHWTSHDLYGWLLKTAAAIDEIESMDLYRRDFEWSHTTMDRLRTRPGKGALLSSIAAVKLAAGPDEDEVDLIGALKPKAPRPGKRRGDPGPGLEHWLEEVIVAAGVPWADEPHEPPIDEASDGEDLLLDMDGDIVPADADSASSADNDNGLIA